MSKEINLHETDDAVVWAKEFMRIFGDRRDDIDEGLMISWFANAIMMKEDMESKYYREKLSFMPRTIEILNETCYKKHYIENYEHNDHVQDFGICWFTKESDSYVTMEGLEYEMTFLAKYDIDHLEYNGLGFSTKNQKWYGWSHRAFCGFEIGSKVKKGDCAYMAGTPKELHEEFLKLHDKDLLTIKDNGVEIEHKFEKCSDPECPWKSGTQTISLGVEMPLEHKDHNCTYIPEKSEFQFIECGKGEWEAKTLEDAREMAEAFANNVA